MSVKYTQAVRLLVVFGLFLAVPLIAFEQRFGPSASGQRGTNVQAQQPPTQTPTAAQSAPRQQNQGRNDGPWEWWKDAAVKKELNLSERQVRDISNIYDRRVREMKPVSEALEKEREVQNAMAKERQVEVALFAVQVNKVEALRTELNKSRSVMFYAISRQLSTEQHQKLPDILNRRFAGRRGGGPR